MAAAERKSRDKGVEKMNRNQSAVMSAKMVIAMLLLAVSFLTLFLPWVEISIDVAGRKYTPEDLVQSICYEEDISRAEFDYELQDQLYDTMSELSDYGVSINEKKALKAIDLVLDGKFSVWNMAKLTSYANSLTSKMVEYLEANLRERKYGSAYYQTVSEALSNFEDAKLGCLIGMLVIYGLLILATVCFFLALRSIWTGRKGGLIAYIVIYLVMFVGILLGLNEGNEVLARTLGSSLSSMVEELGLSRRSISFELLHLASAPIWGIVLVGAATVVSLLGGGSFGGKAAFTSVGNWVCSSCGCSNDGSGVFCMACGTKRPERTTCECGAPIKPDTSFCGKCGRRLDLAEDMDY